MTTKELVQKKVPGAICYQSNLTGMFFVMGLKTILGYQPNARKAWGQALRNVEQRERRMRERRAANKKVRR